MNTLKHEKAVLINPIKKQVVFRLLVCTILKYSYDKIVDLFNGKKTSFCLENLFISTLKKKENSFTVYRHTKC